MIVYVVTMHRWGESETHNYCIGVFTSHEKAVLIGNAEEVWRGRPKYEHRITELVLDAFDKETLEYYEKSC